MVAEYGADRRAERKARARISGAAAERWWSWHGRSAQYRQCVPRNDTAPDERSGPARARTALAMARLYAPVVEHGSALSRRRDDADRRAPTGRPPLQGRGLAGEHALRLHQAELLAHRALVAIDGAADRRAR